MDWRQIAKQRLLKAEETVRAAESSLHGGNCSSQERYRNALRELDFARKFLRRVESETTWVEEARGIFC